jgi:two-component system, NarL family, nitrate/nitrite response regulator NarL
MPKYIPKKGTAPGRLLSIASRKAAVCRLFIADPDALARAAVAGLIDRHPLIRLADELASRDELLAEVDRQEVEIILIDLNLPPAGGLDALRHLRELRPVGKVVMMGEAMDDWAIAEAIRLGARGVLSKDAARELLVECLSQVYAGHYWVERHGGLDSVRMLAENTAPVQSNVSERLSQREKQVIGFILEGCTNRQIAETLQTSEQVVKNYLSRIFDKVGVYNRLELALYALNHRLLTGLCPAAEQKAKT